MSGRALLPEHLGRTVKHLAGKRPEAQAAALGLRLNPVWRGDATLLEGAQVAYDGRRPRGERRADIRRCVARTLLERHGIEVDERAVAALAFDLSAS
jgi:hypothetical protein